MNSKSALSKSVSNLLPLEKIGQKARNDENDELFIYDPTTS